jgi:hypothetical protein
MTANQLKTGKGLRRDSMISLARGVGLGMVAALLLSACAGTPSRAVTSIAPTPGTQIAQYDPKNGDGLGGTGIRTADNRHGDGLGGTGVVGTISGFGSIIVNGLELEFDHTTNVAADGRPASLEALRIGQVIQGVARNKDGKLQLESLEIQHAVSGTISAIDYSAQTMTVLGQTIRLNLAGDKVATAGFRTLHVGDQVSVSGLRLSDGTIFASRVDQHADDDREIVRGVATIDGSHLRVGALDIPLTPDNTISKPTEGGRVFVSGRMINGAFVPDVVTGGTGLPFAGHVSDVSLEGYAPKAGKPLTIEGATVSGALPSSIGPDDHIVVTGQIATNGTVTAANIAKVRTVVTIMKAQGSQRPAQMRPDNVRPERVAPMRPDIQRPESNRPEVPSRPVIERPGSFNGV